MSEKFAWIFSPKSEWEDAKDLITTSLESGIKGILTFDSKNNSKIKKLGIIQIISKNDDSDIYLVGNSSEGDGTHSLDNDLNKSKDFIEAQKLKSEGKVVCSYIEITDKLHEQFAVKMGEVSDYIILVTKDWTIIPLENIIAALHNKNVKIVAAVKSSEDAKVAIETLEKGTDGFIFEPENIDQIKNMVQVLNNYSNDTFNLQYATVTNIKPLGSGDRVCVDTTSIMRPGEGMLIGSYSKAMILVHSESIESEYVAARPFRVNAGPVQAYIMVPNGKTRYLSELETGDEVLIVNNKGQCRKTIVGRCKIETRPLLLIEAVYNDINIKTLIQNAETIRLVGDNDIPVSVTSLKQGDKIKVYINDKARHFGMDINENIIEK